MRNLVACAICGLQVRYSPNPDGLYVVEMDSAEFAGKCQTPNKTRAYRCVSLDLALMLTHGATPHDTAAVPLKPDWGRR